VSRRKRIALIAAGSTLGLLLLASLAALLVLRSAWFSDQVRRRIVAEVERATGGRTEIGSFSFDWRRLHAEVRDFTLHGTEPAGKPPLFHAGSVAVGITIVSLLEKRFNIDYARVERPRVYLIVQPDGRTNVPAPRVKRSGKPVLETILDIKIRRFELNAGAFEVENRYKLPLDGRGENLQARLAYDASRPRYQGTVAVRPLRLVWSGYPALPVDVAADLAVERNRVEIPGAQLATGASRLTLNGSIEGIGGTPAGAFRYQGAVKLEDLARALGSKRGERGEVLLAGNATVSGSRYEVSGNLHAAGVGLRLGALGLAGVRGDAALHITPEALRASRIRLSGAAAAGQQKAEFGARVESAVLARREVEIGGIRLASLGGTFHGQVVLRDFERYQVEGELTGFQISRLLALYTGEQPPWDGRISGPVRAAGSLRRTSEMAANAQLAIAPAETGAPVHGAIDARYDGRGGTLDLGHSFLQLPATRLEFAGVLGRRLDVRLSTTDLDDLLPALNVKSLPVRLTNGTAAFTGTVTGKLDNPLVAGELAVKSFAVEDRRFDSLTAVVEATRNGVAARGARLAQGALRARFNGSLGLRNWKPDDSSPLVGDGALENADIATLASIPVTGTLNASARLSGTYGNPLVQADLTAVKGAIQQEPYDRITAKVSYRRQLAQVVSAEVAAGTKRIGLAANYQHANGGFRNGTLYFQAKSNAMPVEQIHRLIEQRPDLRGTVQLTANGVVQVAAGKVQIAALNAEAAAQGMQMSGQPLGDTSVTATTKGNTLAVHLESDVAGSRIRGDGQWQLSGDNRGSARITMAGVRLGRLDDLLNRRSRRRIRGLMDGEAEIKGPLLDPRRWDATLRIAQLRVGPSPTLELPGATQDYVLNNASPVVVTMSGGVVRIQSARFVGRSTDIGVAGGVNFNQKNALDLKISGRVDLATLQDFDRDFTASGTLLTDATIRGALARPQVVGQAQIKAASISYAGVPNGIYNANGLVRFTGTQATIPSLEGESGGGKVALKGFIGYGGDETLVRLMVTAKEVRVRYPQGVSTVTNANLNLTGTTTRSTLAGTITIVRTGFNPHSDIGSILARSAEPVRTPSPRTGWLSGLHFDVQIETAPDITFQSTLAQDIQVDANLRLRGTATNPSMLGRINITQGELMFFGTKYTINQGSISFFNPVRVEPILNVDLETKARGIDVTLTVSGPLSKLNMTPRSDPPLQFSEIVALLATGRTPTSDPSLVAQQTTSPQSWQQMGASALLGQAIANPVAGRLQRFFGVTRLKIDPTLAGVENNPQARLTLEQQITPNITFTYITNVTNTNPLVIQIEWAISPRFSVLAVRDENGWVGLDFLYKKRF